MALFICVILMSIVILNYIIVGQYLLAVVFKYFPIYGYEFGLGAWKFVLLAHHPRRCLRLRRWPEVLPDGHAQRGHGPTTCELPWPKA